MDAARDPRQRVAGADAAASSSRPSSTRCSRVADKWGVLATAIGEVTDGPSRLGRRPGTASSSWTSRRGSLADDGPVYARPMREPADLILLQADRAETLPRPRTGDELRATLLRLVAVAEPVRQDLGHRAVRPLRARQHRARPARGRRRHPHRRGDRARHRARPSTATAGTPGSTRTTARSSRWPRRTATSPSPAPSRSRSPTASTSARPRTRRSCGSSPRPCAASPTAARSSASRSPAATSASTTRPARRRSTRRRSSACSASSTTSPPRSRCGFGGRRGRRAPPARRDPARARPAPSGPGSPTGTSAAGRRRSTWPPSSALAELLAARGRAGLVSAAHDLSDGGLAQALVESALRHGVGAPRSHLPDDADPFTALFSESAARAVVTTSDPAAP